MADFSMVVGARDEATAILRDVQGHVELLADSVNRFFQGIMRSITMKTATKKPAKSEVEKIPQPIKARYDLYACTLSNGIVRVVLRNITLKRATEAIETWDSSDSVLIPWPSSVDSHPLLMTFRQEGLGSDMEAARELANRHQVRKRPS